MAFGDVYGYRTNVGLVVALAESDEYADGDDTKVDLVLTGQSSGGARRRGVVVGPEVNQAQTAAVIND